MTRSRQRCRQKDSAVVKKTALSDSPAETYTPKDFSPSKTNKTNQTLSEATRERNLALWENLDEADLNEIRCYARSVAIPQLPIKPSLEEKWIASQCNELANQCQRDFEFQKSYYELRNSNSGKRSGNSPTVENEEVNPSW